MEQRYKVAVLVGSLRRDSYSRKTAKALIGLAPDSLRCKIVEIGDMPLYNEDLEKKSPPESWQRFRKKIKDADAVLFVTPEYNRSIPAPLKNAVDVGSRPYGNSAWDGKPGAVVGVSPGAIGGFGANQHLRQTFVFMNVKVMQQPEAYIGGANKLFNDRDELTNESTKGFLKDFMDAFEKWIVTIKAGDERQAQEKKAA